MFRNGIGILALGGLLGLVASTTAADNYKIDPVHSSVHFKIRHMDISDIYGRFNEVAGNFVLDKEDPSKSSFTMTIKTDSVDTNNKGRDKHLRSPDFFNAPQFPEITFKSTEVKPVDGGYEVTGDFTMHGVTKPISFTLKGGKEVEFPPGRKQHRTGFATQLDIKRTDFGIEKFVGMLGDEVHVGIGFEGVKE
jgi:polyisoprenoid-binding protein YceI